jgi:hypothetical protein
MTKTLLKALSIGPAGLRSDAKKLTDQTQRVFRGGQVPVTKLLAEEVSRMPVVTGYREYSQDRAGKIAYLIATGQSVPFCWTVARCLEDDQYYLVDGRTSSQLLSRYADERLRSYSLQAQLTHVTVASYRQVVSLVDCYDVGWSTKSLSSCLAVAKSNKDQYADISARWVRWGYGGLTKMLYGFSPRTGGGSLVSSNRSNLLDDYADYFAWLQQTINLRKLCFTGLSAAVFSTWSDCPIRAAVFWNQVTGSEVARHSQPVRTLRKLVNGLTEFDRRSRQSLDDTMLLCIKALRCWKSHLAGRPVKRLSDTTLEKFSIGEFSDWYQVEVPDHLRQTA